MLGSRVSKGLQVHKDHKAHPVSQELKDEMELMAKMAGTGSKERTAKTARMGHLV